MVLHRKATCFDWKNFDEWIRQQQLSKVVVREQGSIYHFDMSAAGGELVARYTDSAGSVTTSEDVDARRRQTGDDSLLNATEPRMPVTGFDGNCNNCGQHESGRVPRAEVGLRSQA
jgi:hypothetical protein